MHFTFGEKEYSYPNQLSDITLGQRIEFHERYGANLDKRAKEIAEMEAGADRELEYNLWGLTAAVESFSFFTGLDAETVKSKISLDQILNVYNASLVLLLQEEQDIEFQEKHYWKGEMWTIAPPELQPSSEMIFNEFLTAKEAVRQLVDLGKGKWDALPYLCCVYFRKEGEEFTDALVDPEGERMKLMYELPLNLALCVGFFLSDTLNIWQSISQSSINQREKELT